MGRAWPILFLILAACGGDASQGEDYFDRQIQPILTQHCTTSGGGPCHTNDGQGRAMGNLDLTSYDSLQKRPDVLRRFGSYPFPLLLMKAVARPPQEDVTMDVEPVSRVHMRIRHGGGPVLQVNDEAFYLLQQWLEDGATRDGYPPPPPEIEAGPCSPDIRTDLFAQAQLDAVNTDSDGYKAFMGEVWPFVKGGIDEEGVDRGQGCLGRECHGVRDTTRVPTVELYFTCGDNDQQQRFNYLMARTYTGAGGRGQLNLKPLLGGAHHAGGKPWETVDDPAYVAIRDWSAEDPPYELQESEGEEFFRNNVQPALMANGCYLEACHSLVNFNFYKPLAGTDGLFGTRVNLHNYLQARFMLGLESPDPTQGRLIKKNLLNSVSGIAHRGGPLFEPLGTCELDVAAVRADPTRRWFEEASSGCIVYAWHQLERQIAVENGQLDDAPGMVGAFVTRPANPDRLIDFDTYRPGADLLRMDFTQDAGGRITGLAGDPVSLLGNCGINVADADVRRPDINGPGTRVVFAMRTSASEGLALWQVDIDGQNCQRLTGLDGGTDSTGTPIHYFDPAYGPGGVILFASNRPDTDNPDPARQYASKTPKFFLPNSNIWLFAPGGVPQRLSHLNGAELMPRLLRTREVVYNIEKAAPDFYQISTRAIRMDDGGGYRPQLGQRPKMGYGQVTEMSELADFRTVFIASDPGTYFAGGTLGVHELTFGLEELTFQDAFFHPVTILDPSAAARPGQSGTGAYRSPTPLPDGRILVAYSPGNVDLGSASASVDYGLYVVDPQGLEAPWLLYDSPGDFDIEPTVAFRRIFVPQPNRIHQGDPVRGEYVFHSIPLFAPLLNDQTRVQTVPNDNVASVRVLEQLPPPDGTASASDVSGQIFGPEQVFVSRRLVGEAPLLSDGSIRIKVPSNTPLVLELLDGDGNVIDWQREEEQIGTGETQPRMIQLELFNAVCGGCHNALDGTELGVSVGPEVITGASTRSEAARGDAVDLYSPPDERPAAPFTGP